ncbi:Lem3/Cdc50 [Polychaeton citri CBS 116435]|uniref:Lem3/Cdc50 n=1 Tax=Polychaeton citri CBS 116435 TaxID=1314669 RepID=A0A9P4Q2B5_9PEZI|nr:Lem3/Cdc50 [Polychaeton citri CBS 116435]
MSQTVEHTDSSSLRSNEEPDKKQKSRRPANTAFRQQRLKAWQPILTPKTVLPLFFAVGILFAPIGGLLIYASSQVEDILIDYTKCNFPESQGGAPVCSADDDLGSLMPSGQVTQHFKMKDQQEGVKWCQTSEDVHYGRQSQSNNYSLPTDTCRISFHIPNDIGPPVLLYYQLTNFYQNHRRYVKSFDQDQLKGNYRDNDTIQGSDCDPLRKEPDPQDGGVSKAIYPCGLIANSLFNDTYFSPTLLNTNVGTDSETYHMINKGIAWDSDADLYKPTAYKYGEVVPPPNWSLRYPDGYNEDFPFPPLHEWEEFQNWMRTAGLPTFSKLALRNDNATMITGTYQMKVYNLFPAHLYDGTKSILISTRTVMGGKNSSLGIAYVVVGGICIVLGALFLAFHLIKPRKLGDHSYLSWNTDQPSTATTSGRAPRPGDPA